MNAFFPEILLAGQEAAADIQDFRIAMSIDREHGIEFAHLHHGTTDCVGGT
jgi:hypothetical protein